MNKTPLETFFNSLIPNLWEELIFYIPNKDFPKNIIDNFKNLNIEKFFNQVLVMDTFKGPIKYKEGRNNKEILLKGAKLENNLYRLLEKEHITNLTEFNFILDKYLEQVECLKYMSEWMYSNLDQIKHQNETIKGLFLMQSNHFEKHLNVFVDHFYKNRAIFHKNDFDLESIIKSKLKEITIQNATIKVNQNNTTHKSQKKSIKQPLVAEEDAKKMILKQVFNLDLNIIN